MKFALLISLLFFINSISSQNTIGSEARDFLKGLMSTVKETLFSLDDQCFGSNFDTNLIKLKWAINNENTLLFITYVSAIIKEFEEKCPSNDLSQIYNDTMTLINDKPTLATRLITRTPDSIHIMREELLNISTGQFNPENLGEAIGKIINYIVYNKPREEAFLKHEEYQYHQMSEQSVEEFVNGFFEGVSSVPYEQNKCALDVATVKSEIVKVFADILDAIKTRKDIVKAITELIQLSLKLKSLDGNCKFSDLSADIISLSTKEGMAKLVFRVSTHLLKVLSDIKGTVQNFEEKLYRKSGVDFGGLVKISLNYSTI